MIHFDGMHQVEALWSTFQKLRQGNSAFSIAEFAEAHPKDKECIRYFFPMLDDLRKLRFLGSQRPECIEHFDIIQTIGVGGMGVVYESQNRTTNERVAIKVLHRFDGAERFEREASLAASLKHSHIVPVYDFGVFDEKPYYTMELIDGLNLAEILHHDQGSSDSLVATRLVLANKMSELLADNWSLQVRLAIQAADAVAYAHSQGILHRDIKPANLLLDEKRKLWVTDFGLAKQVFDESPLTTQNHLLGTPRYMAPEQLRGATDQRSDIFGLGLVMYEMAISSPHRHKSRRKIWHGGLRSPQEWNPAIPDRLSQIIKKAVALDPLDRYQSMSQLSHDLAEFQSAPRWRRRRSIREQKRLIPVVAASSLLLIALFVATVRINSSANPPSSRSQLTPLPGLANDRNTPADLHLSQNPLESVKQREDVKTPFDSSGDPTSIYLNDRNEPPRFDTSMFEADGMTIEIDRESAQRALLLQAKDDQDSVHQGLTFAVSGGPDQDRLEITPAGVLIFIDPPDRSNLAEVGIYDVELTLQDRTSVYFARLQQTGTSTRLIRDRLSPQGTISSEVWLNDVSMRMDVIDFATADGQTFFHIHRDNEGSAALLQSKISANGDIKTTELHPDCGIDQDAIGFSTINGQAFHCLVPSGSQQNDVTVFECHLKPEGTFDMRPLSASCGLFVNVVGFGSLDGRRFHTIQKTSSHLGKFNFSFLRDGHFTNLLLHDQDAQFGNNTLGYATWTVRDPDSKSTVKNVKFLIR